MDRVEDLKQQIRSAFRTAPYPGDSYLVHSNEGEEPFLLEAGFNGKSNWQSHNSKFLDQAPDGFASALNFFSAAAFRFYLPDYLLADLEGDLLSTNPIFHLTHGLTAGTRSRPINPKRYGDLTWFEYIRERFAKFSQEETGAITAYLELKLETADSTNP